MKDKHVSNVLNWQMLCNLLILNEMKCKNKILFLFITTLLVGCGHSRVVVAPEVRTEIKHDSIFIYDQLRDFDSTYVAHSERAHGDTILIRDTLVRYKTLYRDNVVEISVDKIKEVEKPYPVEVVKEVRKRNWYDRMTSAGFWILIAFIIALLGGQWAISKRSRW